MPDGRILTFHGIGKPDRELEPGEARFWLGTERFTAILDRIAAHPDRNRFRITFDDSNSSDLGIAAPHLLRRGLKATFFVLTGRIGQRGSLSPADIRDLMARGMNIASHGVAHRDWTRLNPADLRYELVASKMSLQTICRAAIEAASIPFGRYNAAVLRALRAAGYCVAYSSDRGSARPSEFLRPRTSIRCDTTEAELEQILSGHLPPFRRLRRSASMAFKKLL